MDSARPRLAVVSAEIPSAQSASGFAPRLDRFLKAARQRMDVSLAVIDRSGDAADPGTWSLLDFRRDEVRVFSPRLPAWRRRDPRGRLLRALIQYPFDPLPYECYPRRLPALRDYLRQTQPDVVAYYLPYLSHLIGHSPVDTPVIVVLEEPWEWVVAASVGRSAKDRWLVRRETARFSALYRRIDQRAKAVVAISEPEASYFAQMISPQKIRVIAHGVDTDYYRPQASRDPDLDVLVVGRLRASHNLDGAVRTWEAARSAAESRAWRWAFVGGIDAAVAERLRAHGCLVTGEVADVRPFYERACCVLVPALAGRGVKTTSLQAWAMGRPLVTSPVGAQGVPAAPGDNILVGADPAEMVAHVGAVLRDPALAKRLAVRGRETVERLRDSSVLADAFARLCVETAVGFPARGQPLPT